jgi:ribosomal protein S18 acetylase RimI-like enzyme
MAVDSPPDFAASARLPPIPGLRFRHFVGPSDYPAMNDVANDARHASGDHFITPLDGFANYYESFDSDRCDKARDLFIVEVDGRIAGYGRTAWHDVAEGRIHELVCFLHPRWAETEIEPAMLAALERRATEVWTEHGAPRPAFFEAGDDGNEERGRRFVDAGYVPVRHGYQMVRPTLDPLDDAPLPEGLEIRPVRDEHLRAIWEAADEAFSDAWGYRQGTERDFQLFLTDPLEAQRSLWRIAWDGDQVAGQVRGFINADENERFHQTRGWVENVSVRRPWRRRGLARALINATFEALRERGMTEAALGVDTENVTGALRLYESVGFRPVSKSTTFRKPITEE